MLRTALIGLLLGLLYSSHAHAQDSLSVLFLGNSYTSYNDLPGLVRDMSTSAGKHLVIDASMPGGFTISGHLSDPNSFGKVRQGRWDYVIIQEQSQIPTIDFYRYNSMYPALTELKDTIEKYNPCAKLIIYMTWGRRFGGRQCDGSGTYCSPDFTDFNHMQDSLASAYLVISELLNIQCAPVGMVWQNILNDTSLVLHSSDNSHPSLDGSYVAACAIYSSLWKLPSQGRFFPNGISGERARYFQAVSDSTLFESANDWNLFINQPRAEFSSSVNNLSVRFLNESVSATGDSLKYNWSFGDGLISDSSDPMHVYGNPGNYLVTLISSYCNFSDTIQRSVQVAGPISVFAGYTVYPNPANEFVRVKWEGSGLADISLFGSCGELIRVIKRANSNVRIPLAGLSAGVYFLVFSGAEGKQFRKLVISR